MSSAVRTIKIARDVSSGDFRSAMRHLAGGVSVITVGLAKDITGMTVTSVSSLSVDPPTLIVSINRESSSWPLLKRHGTFGVNILAADQLDCHGCAPHSLSESPNAPACSRTGWNCAVFSENLTEGYGTFAASRAFSIIGWSSSAGSQNEAARKTTPSARW